MSRIGKRPIPVPAKVELAIEGATVRVSGPRGELNRVIPREMTVTREDGAILVSRPDDAPRNRALHGLTRTLVANMVQGVSEGFTRTLDIQGVGYRAQKQGEN